MNNLEANYISLHEAAKLTNYSQDYISLLCRQKKVKGIKIGRNWVTTKEWVQGYINRTKGSGQNVISVRVEDGTETEDKTEKKEIVNTKENESNNLEQEKHCKSLSPIKAYQSQAKNSIPGEFILASFLASFVVIGFISFNLYSSTINQSLSEYSKIIQDTKSVKYLSGLLSSDLNLNDILKNEKGRVAGVKDSDENDDTISDEKNDLTNEEMKGLVVVPLEGNINSQENRELIKNISSSFSDDVIINPSEDGASGVITSENNPEDNYLYLMVPVNEEANIQESTFIQYPISE